jgi:hypothetical protein
MPGGESSYRLRALSPSFLLPRLGSPRALRAACSPTYWAAALLVARKRCDHFTRLAMLTLKVGPNRESRPQPPGKSGPTW